MSNQPPSTCEAPDRSLTAALGPTVYFDGACPVCSREIAVYRRQPGAESCTWVDVTRCDDSELGAGLTRDAALKRLHVRQADGRLVHGALGFAALWSALPRTALLGRVASLPPVAAVLELAYRAFLGLRGLWRPAAPVAPKVAVNTDTDTDTGADAAWSARVTADLRSDHAGEVGAIQIYRGALAVARDPALRRFAQDHMAAEVSHLACIERHLPATGHSRLLPAWRVAGWLTGALPALFGPRVFHATVAAVERFVDGHYAEQIEHIDATLAATPPSAATRRLAALRADLQTCREDEIRHRDEALAAGASTHPLVRAWAAAVGAGSGFAVTLARRV